MGCVKMTTFVAEVHLFSRSAASITESCVFQALDTNDVPPRGFGYEHNYFIGDRLTCSKNRTPFLWQKVWKNNSIYRNPNKEHPPFEFRLFIGHMRTIPCTHKIIRQSRYMDISLFASGIHISNDSSRNATCNQHVIINMIYIAN